MNRKMQAATLVAISIGCSALAADRGSIAPGETRSALIQGPSYFDTWEFEGQAGHRVLISAVVTNGTADTEMILYPPGGGPAEADSVPWGDSLDHQLLTNGTYTLVVQDYGLNDSGAYNLTLLKFPGAVNYAGDLDGGPVAPGETVLGSRFNVPSDRDVFQFYGSAGDRVLISAVATSGTADTEMILYPPGGGPAEADSVPWGDSLDHQLLTNGLYMLVVQDYGLNDPGCYDFSFAKIPGTTKPGVYNLRPIGRVPVVHGDVAVAWDAVAGATAYDIYIRSNSISAFSLAGSTVSNSVSLPVESDIRYDWFVRAHRPQGATDSPQVWIETAFGFLEVAYSDTNSICLTTSSGPGHSYWLEATDWLQPPTWTAVRFSLTDLGPRDQTNRIGTGGNLPWFVDCATNRTFYRMCR